MNFTTYSITFASAAVFSAIAETAWMASHGSAIGRLIDLRLLWYARYGLEKVSVNLGARLPAFAGSAWDLSVAPSLAAFTLAAIATSLVATAAVATVAYPVFATAQRAMGRTHESRYGGIEHRTSPVTIGVFLVFAVPAFTRPLAELTGTAGSERDTILACAAAVAVAWTLLSLAARSVGSFAAALRWTPWAVGAIAIAFLAGAAVEARLGEGESNGGQTVAAAADAPNILLISIDSLRADHLGAYGYERDTSPVIDALAAEGVLFERCYSPTSWTLPAHATMLTGLPPEGHGVDFDGKSIGRAIPRLPEILQDAGYATSGFVSGPYLSAEYGFLQGFDHYDDYSVVSIRDAASHEGIRLPIQLELLEKWLRDWHENSPDKPFFAFLHIWEVHYDFTPPPPYDSMFDPGYSGNVDGTDFEVGSHIHAGMDKRDLEHVVALYDGEIRFTDASIGKVLELLDSLGVRDDVAVVVTSDHGDEFFEYGHKGHRKNLFEPSIHVPLIVSYPRALPSGVRVERPVGLMHVVPTVLELAGIDYREAMRLERIPQAHAPRSLTGDDSDNGESRTPVFAELHGHVAAAIDGTRKLVVESAEQKLQLYDLSVAGGEARDIAADEPQTVARLQSELEAWQRTWRDFAPGAVSIELDPAHLDQLRSLGYIE